ncbi:hypothetical protein MN032_03595 [Agromyces atrinae]|uniref:hypothetical protein n=1 Tax=Agromyces atrinae TaxID=592376 RepID=UPI001F58D473|nr:hypothetical protein [Agromyces atrinae]MCI2956768.1 hypothetical protein [Agromyces atrinae]
MTTSAPTRRPRVLVIIALSVVAALLVAAGVWWGVARASAHAAADEATTALETAHSASVAAAETSGAARTSVGDTVNRVIAPILLTADAHPYYFDAEAVATLLAVATEGTDVLAEPIGSVDDGPAIDGLVDGMHWSRDETAAQAAAELERIESARADIRAAGASAEAWIERANETIAAFAVSTADVADARLASFEHADEVSRSAVAARVSEIRELSAGGAAELSSALVAYPGELEAARATHDARVAQLEAERIEAERVAAEQRAAEEAANRAPSNSGGGSGGGGGSCTFVNWQGMVLSKPC